ncbi:MAG: hypothetical protein AAFN93_12390 [Bacteroidota bacterium]
MMDTNNYSELLDSYFRNEMSKKEQEEFLSKVDSDEKLREMFEQHGDIVKAIELSSLKSLKDQLINKEKELSTPSTTSTDYTLYLKIAAGVCIIALSTWLLIKFNSTDINHPELFAANYEPYPNVVNPLNRSSAIVDKDPYELFELKEYTKSLDALENMKKSDTTIFYQGQIHLALNNPDLAIERFNEIQSSSSFSDASQWYLALTYMSKNDIKTSKNILKNIVTKENAYSKRAQSLLKSM